MSTGARIPGARAALPTPASPAASALPCIGSVSEGGKRIDDEMRAELQRWRGLSRGQDSATAPAEVPWTTLGEGLEYLAARGVSPNVASFVGAATVRRHVLGEDDVAPTPEQLDHMRARPAGNGRGCD